MSGHALLITVAGGIALLIWATEMVKTEVMRAFGARLRSALTRATSGRLRACLTGLTMASAVQSSSATALVVAGLAEQGLVALAPALAIMLGADIGSTLVVQVLSVGPAPLVPVLLVAGVAATMLSRSTVLQQGGRIVIGLALMILSLGMIVSASEPLRDNPMTALVLQRLADDPILAVLVGALLAWLAHSSVALVLLVMSLAGAGVLSAPAALAFVLGANVGSGLVPLGLAFRSPARARRVLLGNLSFRIAGAALGLVALLSWPELPGVLGADAARQVANAHTGFNLALGILFLPFVNVAARLFERLVKDESGSILAGAPTEILDEGALDRPAAALGNATRAVIRLADTVETMLRSAILTFRDADEKRRIEVSRLDDEVDRLQEAFKLYLTRLTRQPLDDDETRRCFDLILFTTNLEHVGDIIDRGLLGLAAKRQRAGVAFSEAGWAEIVALHQRILDQMRMAANVFVTRDLAMARELVAEKDRIRAAERSATESHLQRLRDGTLASIETSALHLDVLRDLKRIAAHLTSVAYPILEAHGELRRSRLVAESSAGESPATAISAVEPPARPAGAS